MIDTNGNRIEAVPADRPVTGERVSTFPLNPEDSRVAVAPLTPPSLLDLPLFTTLDVPLLDDRVTLRGLTNFESGQPWAPEQSRNLVLYWHANCKPRRLHCLDFVS